MRLQPIRTAAQISAAIKILPAKQSALYQKLFQKVKQLRTLGLPYKETAKRLNVSKGTIENALKAVKVSPIIIHQDILGKKRYGQKSVFCRKRIGLFWFYVKAGRLGLRSREYTK